MSERFYLVDGPSYLYRAYHAIGHLSTSRGVPTNATYGITTMLWKLLREERPTYMAVAWDAPGPTFRHERFERYKIQRPGMPRDLAEQLPWVRASIEALGLALLECPGYEADDILATVVARLRGSGVALVLVTADKDALQLVGDGVTVLAVSGRTGERIVYDVPRVRERWGVAPERIPDVLGLMGDEIDNIPGVPGVGEVTARKLLQQFGSLEALYEGLALVPGPRLRETLARYRDQALLSRELARLEGAVPLELDLERFRVREPDWERLRQLWTELEFSSLLRQLPAPARVEATAVPVLDSAGWAAWLARAGPLVAVEALLEGSPPDLRLRGLGAFSPAAGPCYVPDSDLPRGLGLPEGVRLAGHDVKALVGWARARGEVPPAARLEDTAVAAYLLNSGRAGYPLEELCLEALGQAPPGPLASWLAGGSPEDAAPAALAAWAGARAAAVFRLHNWQGPALERDGLLGLYRDLEVPLIPVLAAMEHTGIRVEPERLATLSREIERQLDALLVEIHALAGEPVNPNSPKQLAAVLFEKLKLPPVRRTKTGYSTDVEVLEELALAHPLPGKVLEYRQLAKLKGTYADALPALVHPRTGRIHATFHQLVAATGRLSSSNPNVQNIPIRTELGRRIRQAFVPEPGWTFLAADYSQIELRILAHLSGEEALVEAFRRGEDIHARTAARLLGVAPEAVTPEMRRLAKVVNFGVLYGISGFGLAQAASLDRREAQRYIDEYFAAHPRVRAFLDRTLEEGRTRGYVTTLLGRRRYVPELQSRNAAVRAAAERMAVNAPIQGSASDLIKLAMVRLADELARGGFQARILLQVHDELLLEVPGPEREAVRVLVPRVMESVMTLDVPLRVDVAEGADWAQV